MAKYAHADTLDGGPAYIKTNCTRMVACSSSLPAVPTYTECNATYALADVTMATGDFTLGAYSSTGRQCAVTAKTGVTVDNSGTFANVAFLDVSNSKVLYVTTGTSQVLTAGNTCDFPAVNLYKVAQPS